ncbi:SusC/RagA family TonB-linked outer membrane protein [Marinoscillum furvescens]|uniref:TonB-linked SusC/RagA family outer membrane protein n=1 Tax=Marinoscillum furvescens DSM 4134 TaxID=1122208 RepID=A0A3D9L8Q5_MARFU|nr:TonB-dependent receptor [Marinoscillum furvescens]REE02220.1 TonB-linked SusC/RagA family outer membrane protein [Marinoscillum furvescens DSM 4134]
MKRNSLLTLVAMLSTIMAWAQQQISGTITADGEPLPGVTILEEGTTNGTITDIEGTYTLNLQGEDPMVVVSMVGFKTTRIAAKGRVEISLDLEEDVTDLEEVVVIGYGTATKKEITSSISTVKGEDLTKMTVGNVSESMQGLASGVQVISGGGGPGASPQILIRGIVTNRSTAPLIVVDGVALPQGSNLNFLNPSDIENIQVLKDGSATSIYGTRASNGVIIVNTKRGKSGEAKVTFSASYGLKGLDKPEVADANEYARVVNQRAANDGLPEPYDLSTITESTDWWEEVYKDYASVENYNLQVSGGSEKLNYLSSVAYHKSKSHLEKGYWERATGRVNIDYSISDKLFLQQDFNPRYEHWENTPNQFWSTLRMDPLTPVYIPIDERQGRNEYSIYARSNNYVWNPVGAVNRSFNETHFFGVFSNTNLEYDITDFLSVSSRIGLNFGQTRNEVFNPKFVIEPNLEENQQSSVATRFDQNFSYVWNNLIKFEKSYGKHKLNATVGYTAEYYQGHYLRGSRSDIILNDEKFRYLDATTGESIQAQGNMNANSLMSYLGRVMYNYDQRYFISGSYRRDGSSRFPVANQWANFFSASAAWDISSESFFNLPFVSGLKLKAGFGQVGNQNIPSSAFLFLVSDGSYVFGENEDRVITNQITQFGNSNLQWETVQDINVGIESGFMNDKLTLSVDYYVKESKDLLFATTLPLYTGSPSDIMQNVGSFESKGLDISLGYNDKIGDWQLSALATLNTNESRAKALAPGNDQLLAQKQAVFGNSFLKITELGKVVGLFYGYETDGLFQNQTEINSHSSDNGKLVQPAAQPGDMKFVDQNNDGELNEEDLTIIGNPFPDFYAGLNVSATYKNLDFTMQWYASVGNDVYNYMKYFQTSGAGETNVRKGLIDEVWTESNPDATIPRLTVTDQNGNFKRSSDYFVEDGSYARLKNLQVGYTINSLNAAKIRLYVSGQNLFTITKYSGFDPEVSSGGIINGYGMDFGRYPMSRTFVLGLDLNF